MIKTTDEINPNIIWNLNTDIIEEVSKKVDDDKKLFELHKDHALNSKSFMSNLKESSGNLELLKKFTSLYKKACKFVSSSKIGKDYIKKCELAFETENFIPLAFAFSPVLNELKEDNYLVPKFGGFPNANYIDMTKYPRCRYCHNYMKFLFQINSEIFDILHNLRKSGDYSPYGGNKSDMTLFGKIMCKRVFYSFYCNCQSHYNSNYWGDFEVISAYQFSDKFFYPKQNSQEDLNKFMIKNKLVSNEPVQEIVDYNLEIQLDDCDFVKDYKFEEMFRKKFPSNGSFLGQANSQQVPKRPFCTEQFYESYFGNIGKQRRMVPFYNWTDSKQDITYQSYIDFRHIGDTGITHGVLDSSCT